ncbi:MAG: hypothetical protein K8S14_01950 [Actinomycetia bacterium]|nr:hypothetical protein [Actinomycetes bacterium]
MTKDSMTKRERVELALNYREADRVPIFDLFHNKAATEHYSGVKFNKKYTIVEIGKAIDKMYDLVRGVDKEYPYTPIVEELENGFVKKRNTYTSWYIKRPFENTSQLKNFLKKEIERIEKSNPWEMWSFWGRTLINDSYKEDFLKTQEHIGDTVLFHTPSAIGLDIAYHRASLELFTYAYMDYPELVSDYMDTLNRHEIERVKYISRYDLYSMSPVALVFCDLAYKNGLMFSPEFLRKELIPRAKKLVATWHEYGVKCIFHSDGDYRPILDDLIGAGYDGIHSMEPLAGWDMGEIKKKYPKLVLVGNIDISQLLPNGSRQEVIEAVKKAIDDAGEGGGYIMASCSEIHDECKLENIIAMLETTWEYGRYDR